MEGVKSLIMCALVLGLVLQQEKIHVEAKSCCPSTSARNVYNSCRFAGGSREACAKLSTCKHFDGSCQPPYDHLTLNYDGGCCPSSTARNIYTSCRFVGGSYDSCARLSGCKIDFGRCQPPYDHLTLHSDTGKMDLTINSISLFFCTVN
uniref:Thionin Osthi1 n=1 Tax=Oryza sativa subsp. japonica TaxID=39947 RepID=Q5Z551_ORYSJ|nr:putative thionin Osthi1 [Oryza sativa Japonica Group]